MNDGTSNGCFNIDLIRPKAYSFEYLHDNCSCKGLICFLVATCI